MTRPKRWDLGVANPEGSKALFIGTKRFIGTQFAMCFDRRWQLFCLAYKTEHPLDWFDSPQDIEWDVKGKKKLDYQWEQVINSAKHFSQVSDERLAMEHVFTGTTASGYKTKIEVLRRTLKLINDDGLQPDPELRADWIMEGLLRYLHPPTESYDDVVKGVISVVRSADYPHVSELTEELVDAEFRRLNMVKALKERANWDYLHWMFDD